MTDAEQISQTTSYHYVLTLSAQLDSSIRQVTQTGTVNMTSGAGATRHQVLAQAETSTRRDNGIPTTAPVNVLFWSLEPNEL